jgi:histidinol-phosphate/aromatic aminotransferase/cobyric acid decarboxylase-like protein
VTRYPAVYARELKRALADYAGVAPEAIVTGCGSDDVLDSAIRAFSEPGDTIAFADPTFAMLPVFARMNGLDARTVPFRADGDVDADALLATGARIIYLCSPNNPTGAACSAATIARIVDGAAGVVIVDEAYIEFAAPHASLAALAPGRANLLVARTLSKAFGLAGLRVGYAVGAPALVADVEKSRGPYKVSGPGRARRDRGARVRSRMGRRARRRGRGEPRPLRERPARRRPHRRTERRELRARRVADAAAAAAAMRARGVAVRPFPGLSGIGDAVRITIGPWPMMERALAALAEADR